MGKRLLAAYSADVLKGLAGPLFDVPGALWGVGVSGGSDSVALLSGLVKAGFGGQLIVLHMNHGWGEADERAEAFVEELCEALDVSLMVGAGNGLPDGGSMEAGAREERLTFFAEQVKTMNLNGVLLGHHADDLVEHVMMRLARGSGLQGLVGLADESVVEGVRYVRPLLPFRKQALRDYVKAEGLGWEDDAVPEGGGLRLRLREALPALLEAGMDVEAMLGSVEALRDAEEVVQAAVVHVMALAQEKAGVWQLPCPALLHAGREVGARVLGGLIVRVVGVNESIRRGKRVALWERMVAEPEGVGELGGARFEWRDGILRCR